jgi:hypothetical protein
MFYSGFILIIRMSGSRDGSIRGWQIPGDSKIRSGQVGLREEIMNQRIVPMLLAWLFFIVGSGSVHAQINISSRVFGGHHYDIYDRTECNVEFRSQRPDSNDRNVLMCIPAAFTSTKQGIQGLAIINGKEVGGPVDHQVGGAIVIVHGDYDIISTAKGSLLTNKFVSDLKSAQGSLFQQFQLVEDKVPGSFHDKSDFQRRAIVVFLDHTRAIIESREALTLSEFARDLASMDVLNALYTDMGAWDEGWYRDRHNKLQVIGDLRASTDLQTNWLVFTSTAHNPDYQSAGKWLKNHWSPPALKPGDPPAAAWWREILYGKFPLPRLSSGCDLVPLWRGIYSHDDVDAGVNLAAIGPVDGAPAAVVYTGWTTGGSGCWEVLTLYRMKNGKVEPVGQRDLEDRARVLRLDISKNSILLDWYKHAGSDPAMDPSIHEVRRLHARDFQSMKARQ